MRIVPADRTTLVPLAPATRNSLQLEDVGENTCVLSSTLKDGSVGWIAKGSSLEVFNMKSAERIAAWCFGAVLKDPHTVVTAVSEVCFENTSSLAVATSSSTTETGLVCLLDLHNSKVTKAIEIPQKVTALDTISGVGNQTDVNAILSDVLRCFCGALAIGTQNGHCYILDLCLDDEAESDELSPVSVAMIGPNTNDMTAKRYQAVNNGTHLCLEFDENSHSRGYFYFKKPDSSVIKTFVADDVFISSLHFMKQIGSLAVGFNFGCFQLWDLSRMNLEYCSRTEDDLAAVTHFAYQEPENDPRNYVYLWVSQGPLPTESMDGMSSCIKMYQACYESRNWINGIGTVFQGLHAIACVFDHFLTKDPYTGWEDDGLGSRLVSCYTLADPKYKPAKNRDDEDSFDEGSSGPDLSLCVFAWEALMGDSNAPAVTHLGIFDLNRWYHAQMPGSVRMLGGTNRDVCPFLAFMSTTEVDEFIGSANLLTVHVDYQSLRRFVSPQIPPPDSFFYPSSMAMDTNFLSENGIVQNKYLGVQMQVLSNMERQGPAILLEPNDLFNLCLYSNLLPKNVQTGLASTSPAGKREALLSVSLDYNLLSFIIRCIREWESGDFNHIGCNLRSILDWAWKRLAAIKESVDKLCVTLYDWSGIQLDSQSLQLLHHHRTSLQHLNCILQTLLTSSSAVTQQGHQDLEIKVNVSSLITQHLSTVLWFQAVGLLPEYPEDEDSMDGQYGYPVKMLREMFTRRRQEIAKLHQNVEGTDLLIIDGIVSEHGSAIRDVWEDVQGSGLYPPPSLSALLNIFLVESVPLLTKRLIVMYVLFDLMHLSPDDQEEKFSARLQAFAQAFCIPRSWSRIIQGLWLLDHKEFEECLLFLLDPMVRVELEPWQNTRIIKSLLFHGRHKLALKFIQTRQPPLATPEDVKLKLSVLLANGLIAQAHEFQQIHRDRSRSDDLLHHLFLGCQQTKRMDKLLQLPLNEEEERHLVQYLQTSQEPHSGELLVIYYLQRSRYIEAIRANAKLKHSIMGDSDMRARERSHARNSIVDRYYNILPKVQRKLAFDSHPQKKQTVYARIEAVKPVPLSAVVNRSTKMHPISQATLIQAVMEKVNQVRSQGQLEQLKGQEEGLQEGTSQEGEEMDTDVGLKSVATKLQGLGPFIGTPSTPRRTSRITGSHTDVFFAVTQKTEEGPISQLTALPNPLGLSPSTYSMTLSPVRSSPLHSSFHNRRRLSRFRSAEILSLLKTPPVKRKHPSQHNTPVVAGTPATPHSILKVRHASRLNTPEVAASPLVERIKLQSGITPSQVLVDRALGSAAKDPRLSLSKTESPSSTPQGTPKLLRFSVPQSPDTSTDIQETDDSQEMDESALNESVYEDEKEEEEKEEEEGMDEEQMEEEEERISPASTPQNISPASTPSPSKSTITVPEFTFTKEEAMAPSRQLPRTPLSQRKPCTTPSSSHSTTSIHSDDSDHHYHPEHRPPLRSVRDRSPTPERISPGTSPHRRRSGSHSESNEARTSVSGPAIPKLSFDTLDSPTAKRKDHSPVFQISQGLDEAAENESDSEIAESETKSKTNISSAVRVSSRLVESRLGESRTVESQSTKYNESKTVESESAKSESIGESESIAVESESAKSESMGERESRAVKSEIRTVESESTESESKSKPVLEEPEVFELSESESEEAEDTMDMSEVQIASEAKEGAEVDYVMNIDESDEEVEKKESAGGEEEIKEIDVELHVEESEGCNEEVTYVKEKDEPEEPIASLAEVPEVTEVEVKEDMEMESAMTTVEGEREAVLHSARESSKPNEESETAHVESETAQDEIETAQDEIETAQDEIETAQDEIEMPLLPPAPTTPTRKSSRKTSTTSEDAFKTPAQSAQTAVMLPTPPESSQGTPTKEKRLSSSETVVQPTAEVTLTPRRGRARAKKTEEPSPSRQEISDAVVDTVDTVATVATVTEEKKDADTPSRRGRPRRKVDGSPEKDEKSEAMTEVLTPSRRGRPPKKTELSPDKSTIQASPSRRGRPRKADPSPDDSGKETVVASPSRRGRPRRTDSSPDKSSEREQGVPENSTTTKGSPSRRGRPRKADSSPDKSLERDAEVSPSRGGRPQKTDTSPKKGSENSNKDSTITASPARRGRPRKTDLSPEKADEKLAKADSSPSRRSSSRTTKQEESTTPTRKVRTPQRKVTPSRATRSRRLTEQNDDDATDQEVASQTETEAMDTVSESEPETTNTDGPTASSDAETLVDVEVGPIDSDKMDAEMASTRPSRHSRAAAVKAAEATEDETAVTPSRRGRPRKEPEDKEDLRAVTPTRSTRRTSTRTSLKLTSEDTTQESVAASPSRSSRRLRNASESSNMSELSNASPTRSRRQKNISESSDLGEARQSPSRSSRRLKKISESSEASEGLKAAKTAKTTPRQSPARLRKISESSNASDVSVVSAISTVSNSSVSRTTRSRRSKKVSESETTPSRRTTRRSVGRADKTTEEKTVTETVEVIVTRSRTASESSSVFHDSPPTSPIRTPSTSPARSSEVSKKSGSKSAGSKVRRVPSRRSQKISTSSRGQADNEDSGPLSSASYMMQVRSRTEVTEEESQTTREEVEMEAESITFQFSVPSAIAAKPELMDVSDSPAPLHTFIFSPPITRVRSPSRGASLAAQLTPSSAPSTPRLLPKATKDEALVPPAPSVPLQATKVTSQKEEEEPTEDVRLLTPPDPSEEKPRGGKRVTRSQSLKDSGIGKRYNKKPKRGLKLW